MKPLDKFIKYALMHYLECLFLTKENIDDITEYCHCLEDATYAVYTHINSDFKSKFERDLKRKERIFVLDWIDEKYIDNWE